MSDHEQFLEKLLGRFNVFLLNKYADDRLRFTDGTLRVFLPDLHWISANDRKRYPNYQFNGLAGDLFENLLGVFQSVDNIAVHQTGDRIDFWRASVPTHSTPQETFDEIISDATIARLHAQLNDFKPLLVRGNHDRWMEEISVDGPCPETAHDATNKIFFTHGHIWDQIERLPDTWKAWGVSIAKDVMPSTYDVGPLQPGAAERIKLQLKLRRSNPSNATPLVVKTIGAVRIENTSDAAKVENAFLDIRGFQIASLSSAFDDFHDVAGIVTFGGDVRERARFEGKDCRLFVMGHTHHARLLVDDHPLSGGPLVTMDCGAWIENCRVQGGKTLPSTQFGVQFGNDLRIYQLTAR